MYVKEKLAEEYGEKMLEEGGLVVTTTLDLEKQKIAEETLAAARKNLNAYGASNASLVSLDPRTGQILAMAGSLDYFDKTIDGNVNVSTRLRQPGSSIKPIIYATAFKEGYYPATMLLDVETDFGQNYKPKNYDGRFHGVVSMRTALGNSLNIPAVKTLFLAGVKNSCDLAQEMGISSLTDPDRYGLSLVLGGGEVQLLELTGAYGVFANQGKKAAVTPFLKIETNKGQVLKEYKEDPKEVLDPQVAYLINNVLSDDSARAMTFGMGGILTLPGRPVAAKTGTTDEYRDAWTIGYTPSLVTGVWAGNNDNSEMAGHAAGAMAAAPIWNTFMKKALSGSPVEQFDRPSSIKTIAVEAQTGKLPLGNIPDALKDEYKIKNEVFASFALPKDVDDVHVVKKIIKGSTNLATGTKLAADNCPQGLAEYKIYSIFHSEKPEMPNWENAVLTWATNSGYNELPQDTEDCDEFIKRNQPELKITSPKDGDTATGTLGVEISTTAPLGVAKVDYLLDEELIASSIAAPFSLSYEIPDVVAGKRTLKAKLFDTVGLTAEASIDLNLKIDTTKPKIILEQKSENDSQVLFLATTSSPAGDEVGKVQFYLNGVLLDSVTSNTNGKYEYSWEKSKNPGSYSFYATAVTNGGVTKKSNLLVVNIAPADNQSADDQKKESDNSKIIETPTATSDPSSNPLSSLENLNH